jgi:hypothetical protein
MIPQTIVTKILTNMLQIEGARPMSKIYNRSYNMPLLFKEFALLAMYIAIAAILGTDILVPGKYNRYGLC